MASAPMRVPRSGTVWLFGAASALVASSGVDLTHTIVRVVEASLISRSLQAIVGLLVLVGEIAMLVGVSKLRRSTTPPWSAASASRLRLAQWTLAGALALGILIGLLNTTAVLTTTSWRVLSTLAVLSRLTALIVLAGFIANRLSGAATRLAAVVVALLCAEQIVGWVTFAMLHDRPSGGSSPFLVAPPVLRLAGYVGLWLLVRRLSRSDQTLDPGSPL